MTSAGGEAEGEHHHDANAWAPQDGWERTFYTTLTATLAGAGFSLMLCGVSFLAGIPITRRNGLVWGFCGFIAVSLAPAFSLPPELPGMEAAGLFARQTWWVGTIICTSIAIWFVATPRHWLGIAGAFVLAAVPHIYGAPAVHHVDGPLPAGLAAEFAASSLGANLVMWLLIGLFLSVILNPAQEKTA
jgi:cobalt transporter subunit CbtA